MNWGRAAEFIEPQIGDVVRLPQHRGPVIGVVIDNTCETGWCDVLLEDGELVKWPTVQLSVVEERNEDKD